MITITNMIVHLQQEEKLNQQHHTHQRVKKWGKTVWSLLRLISFATANGCTCHFTVRMQEFSKINVKVRHGWSMYKWMTLAVSTHTVQYMKYIQYTYLQLIQKINSTTTTPPPITMSRFHALNNPVNYFPISNWNHKVFKQQCIKSIIIIVLKSKQQHKCTAHPIYKSKYTHDNYGIIVKLNRNRNYNNMIINRSKANKKKATQHKQKQTF